MYPKLSWNRTASRLLMLWNKDSDTYDCSSKLAKIQGFGRAALLESSLTAKDLTSRDFATSSRPATTSRKPYAGSASPGSPWYALMSACAKLDSIIVIDKRNYKGPIHTGIQHTPCMSW